MTIKITLHEDSAHISYLTFICALLITHVGANALFSLEKDVLLIEPEEGLWPENPQQATYQKAMLRDRLEKGLIVKSVEYLES